MNKIFHGKKTNGRIDKIYCQTSLLMIIELAQLALSYNETLHYSLLQKIRETIL